MEYRGHTITKLTDMFGVFGGDWRSISGPHYNGGTGGGVKAAKKTVDCAIAQHTCKEKTGHKDTTVRGSCVYCTLCDARVALHSVTKGNRK